MQKLMNLLKKNSGYISIEAVIVAGLIIGLGTTAITKFSDSANTVTQSAIDKVTAAVPATSN